MLAPRHTTRGALLILDGCQALGLSVAMKYERAYGDGAAVAHLRGGGAGRMEAIRERLVTTYKLDQAQQSMPAGIVLNRAMDASVMPCIIASQTIPILAIAPMIIVVLASLGITGLMPKAIISMPSFSFARRRDLLKRAA